MPRYGLLVVVLLVLAAGCTGLPVGDEPAHPTSPDPGESTAPSPSDPGGDAPAGAPLPPGLADDGVENASALVDAHSRALFAQGFGLVVERRLANGSQRTAMTYRSAATPGFERFHQNATRLRDGARTVQHSWLNASMERLLVRVEIANETTYRVPPVGPAGNEEARHYLLDEHTDRAWLLDLLDSGDFAVTAVRDGGEVQRYRLVGANSTSATGYDLEEIRATVDPDGVVRSLEAAGTDRSGEDFTYTYRLDRLGVDTLARPAWVAAAPVPVDARPTLGFQNCSSPYLELRNPGPDPIPAGSTIGVDFDGASHTATLEAPLAPGETRALYLDSSGTLVVTAADAVPDDRTAMPSEAGFTVTTAEGMLLANGAGGFGCERASEGAEAA